MGLGPQDRAQGAIHAAARERRRGHAVGESSPDQAEPAITSRSVAAQHEQVVCSDPGTQPVRVREGRLVGHHELPAPRPGLRLGHFPQVTGIDPVVHRVDGEFG
jgi:hypothetical protein